MFHIHEVTVLKISYILLDPAHFIIFPSSTYVQLSNSMPKQVRPVVGNIVKSGRRAAAQKARERIQTQEKEERLSIDRLSDLYGQEDDSPDDIPGAEHRGYSKNSHSHTSSSVRDERYSSLPQRRSIVTASLHDRDDRYSAHSYRSVVPPTLVPGGGPSARSSGGERKIQLGGPRTVITGMGERGDRHPDTRSLGGPVVQREDRLARYIVTPQQPNRRDESHSSSHSSPRPEAYSCKLFCPFYL